MEEQREGDQTRNGLPAYFCGTAVFYIRLEPQGQESPCRGGKGREGMSVKMCSAKEMENDDFLIFSRRKCPALASNFKASLVCICFLSVGFGWYENPHKRTLQLINDQRAWVVLSSNFRFPLRHRLTGILIIKSKGIYAIFFFSFLFFNSQRYLKVQCVKFSKIYWQKFNLLPINMFAWVHNSCKIRVVWFYNH